MTGCNSEVEIETVCLALPVTWLDKTTAYLIEKQVLISWSVAQQTNNDKFIIEHSIDESHFTEIGHIIGGGNFDQEKIYEFVHTNPNIGSNYYNNWSIYYILCLLLI